MESEQATPVVSIKDIVQSFVKVPEFDKRLKKAGGHIGRNVVEITIKIKTIVRKTLMIKIIIFIYSLDGLPLEFEWQQVASSLQDSSQYSGRSQ